MEHIGSVIYRVMDSIFSRFEKVILDELEAQKKDRCVTSTPKDNTDQVKEVKEV